MDLDHAPGDIPGNLRDGLRPGTSERIENIRGTFMASILPSEISSFSADLGKIFTNVGNVAQTVSSIYDQITGKTQNVPGQTGQTSTQSPTVAAPVPVKASEPMLLNSGNTLAIGAVVLIGVLLLISGPARSK